MENFKNKKIYISGGGDEKDSYLLDKDFIQNISGIGKTILYIPIAMDENVHSYESCYDWVRNLLSSAGGDIINVTMWTDLNNKNREDLNKFDAIYIGGGNTFKLLRHIYESNFFPVIKEFITDGGVIYGGSAGAIIMGQNINTVPEENNENYEYEKGFSMIGDYSVICHYQDSLDDRIRQYIKTYNNPVIALTERSGLKIIGSSVKVIGYNPVTIFNLNNEKVLVERDNEFTI